MKTRLTLLLFLVSFPTFAFAQTSNFILKSEILRELKVEVPSINFSSPELKDLTVEEVFAKISTSSVASTKELDLEDYGRLKMWGSRVFKVRSGKSLNTSYGSAFLIGGNYALTNNHVVGESSCDEIILFDPQANNYACEEIIKCDADLDYCLLKINSGDSQSMEEKFGKLQVSSEEKNNTQKTYTMGFPGSVGKYVSSSIVPIIKSSLFKRDYYGMDHIVYSGNSGGPLLNQKGEVIGLVSKGFTQLKVLDKKEANSYAVNIVVIIEDLTKSMGSEIVSILLDKKSENTKYTQYALNLLDSFQYAAFMEEAFHSLKNGKCLGSDYSRQGQRDAKTRNINYECSEAIKGLITTTYNNTFNPSDRDQVQQLVANAFLCKYYKKLPY